MDQCCVFYNQNPERMIELAEFDMVEDYDGHKYGHELYGNDSGGRVLLKCHKCGRYVLRQKSTIKVMDNDRNTESITYWPVESPEEADRLNREYGRDLWRHLQGKRSYIQLTADGDGNKKYHASIIPTPEATKISEVRFELFDPREEADIEQWVRFYKKNMILTAVKIYVDGTEFNELLENGTCYVSGDVDNYHNFGHRSFCDLYESLTSAEIVGSYHNEYVFGLMCCPLCGDWLHYHPATYVRTYGDYVYWDNIIYDKDGKQMNFRFRKEQYHTALEKLKQDYCKLMDIEDYSADDPLRKGEHCGWKNLKK